jgi:hypothetical protein
MSIAFTIRRADLERLITLADTQKPGEGKQWKVFLKVEGHIATFKVHEESAQYPVRTDSPGSAQLLIGNLRDIFYENRREKELNIVVGYGYVKCGKTVEHSDEIRYGISCDVKNDYVLYPNRIDLLAIFNIIDKAKSEELRIDRHLSDVHESYIRDINEASGILARYGVSPQAVQEMADKAVSAGISNVRVRYDL